MFRSFHLWRFELHLAQGLVLMAIEALTADHDRFSLTDALILAAWLEGARDEATRRGLYGTQHHADPTGSR